MAILLSINQAAEKVLAQTYWGTGGWKSPPEGPSDADRALAIRAGYMFDDIVLTHDELIGRTREAAARVKVEDASAAFVASLSTRWLFLRPFLPSVVVAKALPSHGYEPIGAAGRCAVCDTVATRDVKVERSILSFERHKWGGVRHLSIPFVWFCVDRLLAEGAQPLPTEEDLGLFRSLIEALRQATPSTSLSQAERLISLPKSNKQERFVLLESLSVVGVLQDPDHPGFLASFPEGRNRPLPNRRFMDRGYPGEWWTGAHGVNEVALRELFPSQYN